MANATTPKSTSSLSRRTSDLTPNKLILPADAASSSSSATYTSIRDILPSCAVNSPISATQSGYDIGIRNRLVKQAAWAYLQPMSASPDSDSGSFVRRVWSKLSACLSKNPVIRGVTRVFGWFLRVIRVRSS